VLQPVLGDREVGQTIVKRKLEEPNKSTVIRTGIGSEK